MRNVPHSSLDDQCHCAKCEERRWIASTLAQNIVAERPYIHGLQYSDLTLLFPNARLEYIQFCLQRTNRKERGKLLQSLQCMAKGLYRVK